MAEESKRNRKLFEGLGLPGKEFVLPNISSPWLLEEFVLHHNISDQLESESYPTSILDDSCVAEVMRKSSIPLVGSVEAFFLGLIDTPFGSSIKPITDVPISKSVSHDLQPARVGSAESQGCASPPRGFRTSGHSQIGCGEDRQVSSNYPQAQLCLMDEGFSVSGGLVSPDVNYFLLTSSVNFIETCSCNFCCASFTTGAFQGYQYQPASARAAIGREPQNVESSNNLDGNSSKMLNH